MAFKRPHQELLDPDNLEDQQTPLWKMIVVVFLGGFFGSGLRLLIFTIFPVNGLLPFAVLIINVAGSFGLGVLVESLTLRGPDTGALQRFRLFAGTGLIGSFTTYGALATDTVLLLHEGSYMMGVLYVGLSVVCGSAASLAGIVTVRTLSLKRV